MGFILLFKNFLAKFYSVVQVGLKLSMLLQSAGITGVWHYIQSQDHFETQVECTQAANQWKVYFDSKTIEIGKSCMCVFNLDSLP